MILREVIDDRPTGDSGGRFYRVKIGNINWVVDQCTQARQDCRTSMYSASAICMPKLSTEMWSSFKCTGTRLPCTDSG